MFIRKVLQSLQFSIPLLETVIAAIVLFGVLLGLPDLFKYIFQIVMSPEGLSYTLFNDFLKHTLMVVVGIELAIMILNHSHEAILTLVLFVIARKMLVYAETMTDILLGTLSIAVVLLLMKMLLTDGRMLARYDNIYSVNLPIERLRDQYHIDLKTRKKTLIGLLFHLSQKYDRPMEKGTTFKVGEYYLIIERVEDGLISKVKIERMGEQYNTDRIHEIYTRHQTRKDALLEDENAYTEKDEDFEKEHDHHEEEGKK